MLLTDTAPPTAKRHERDLVSLGVGAFGLAAIAFVTIIDLWWGLTLDGYSIVSNTISNLAAGEGSDTLDFALKVFAVAIAAVGLALWRWDLGHKAGAPKRYLAGCAIVLALTPVIYFIGRYDGYSGKPTSEMTIHLYLVYALGVGFPLAAWLTGPGFEAISRRWRNVSIGLGVVWVLAAPYFMFMATSWDGIYERGLAAILLIWFAIAAWNLFQHGRGRA